MLLFPTTGERIECVGANSNRCGHGSTPPVGTTSQRLAILTLYFGPRASGASAHQDEWSRNKYTWNGSYYYILAK